MTDYRNDPSYQDLAAGLPVAQGDLFVLMMAKNFALPANFTEVHPTGRTAPSPQPTPRPATTTSCGA